jgi:hypothetical protein
MFCCAALIRQMITTVKDDPSYPKVMVVLIRFVCGLVLHSFENSEIMSGLRNMKFAINHSYRFTSWKSAFMSGFMQATSAFVIEASNMLVILTSSDELGVVMNFMALTVIAEFDDYIYASQGNNIIKEITVSSDYDYLYKIKTTTSIDASAEISSHLLVDETLKETDTDEFTYIKVNFKGKFMKRLLRLVYQAFRVFHVIWFYYFPMFVLILSYLIPYILQKN